MPERVSLSGLTLLLVWAPLTLCQELLSLYGAPPGGPAGSPSDSGFSSLGGVTEEFLALAEAIPGAPGDDYPVFSQPPDTSFTCGDKIEGYYGDPEADCQSFHICANDGVGGLLKYSFLCPNGTIFNQQYFICDWWFNVDCSLTEDYYYLNEEVAAAAIAASANLANGDPIIFPSNNQGSGVVPGQGFGIEPRLGRLGKKQETERSGNKLSDSFPVDRIPIQFKDSLLPIFSIEDESALDRIPIQFRGSPPAEESSIKLNLKSRAGRTGRKGFGRKGGAFRRKKKFFNKM